MSDPSSFPTNSARQLGLLAQQRDWWSYRQLRALGEFLVSPDAQLVYTCYYQPVIPINNQQPPHLQVGSEHYFKWRILNSDFVIVAFHLLINPRVHTHDPIIKISRRSYKPYPLITCVWHDCPHRVDTITSDFISVYLLNSWGGDSRLDIFEEILNCFFTAYYRPVSPQSVPQNLWPHHPSSPYYVPHQSSEVPEDQ